MSQSWFSQGLVLPHPPLGTAIHKLGHHVHGGAGPCSPALGLSVRSQEADANPLA